MATRTTEQPKQRGTPRQRTTAATKPLVRLPRWRMQVLFVVTLLIAIRVVARLVEVQVVRQAQLATMARREIDQQIVIQPSRGTITDRMGNVLAMDVDRESLWVIPSLIDQTRVPRLALTLAAMIGHDSQELLTAMSDTNRYWVRVARWLEPEVADRVRGLEEAGLRLVYEPRRVYPQNEFAAQIVGAVNNNGDGLSGVELFYNTELQGITGTLRAEFDGASNPIAIGPQEVEPAHNGADLTLTIDPLIQHVIEQELAKAVQAHTADGGTIIVLDPKTGAIRGMASLPNFNPNNYGDYAPEIYNRNPAVSSLYEPGSTFKIITVAAGLQSRAFSADTAVVDNGSITRYGQQFHNWNYGGNGAITPDKVIYYSSNVGALQLNELTGPEAFFRTVKAFGFGQPTGIDVAGEEMGIVNSPDKPNYNELTLISNAFGQSISVTPLQMVRAVAAVANDGVLMKPYMVEKRCDSETCSQIEPQSVGQVLNPGVAWTIRRMLVNSANHYAPVVWAATTGSFADQWLVPGYQVGAKTGTASIPLPEGGYDPNFTIGSVVGFAPAEDARFAIIVKIDRPKDDIWGVSTAVPVYYKVVDQLLRYARVQPDPTLRSPGQ